MLLECHLPLSFEPRQQHQDRIINSIMRCRGEEVLIKWAGLGYDELYWECQEPPMPDITVQLAEFYARRPIMEVRCSYKCLILWLLCLQPHTSGMECVPCLGHAAHSLRPMRSYSKCHVQPASQQHILGCTVLTSPGYLACHDGRLRCRPWTCTAAMCACHVKAAQCTPSSELCWPSGRQSLHLSKGALL